MIELIENSTVEFTKKDYDAMIHPYKIEIIDKSKGCNERCPACNKFCEEPFNHVAEQGEDSLHSCSKHGH